MSEDAHFRIRPQISVVTHSPDEVELRQGVWNSVSMTLADEQQSGRLARLVSRLDGSRSVGAIAVEEQVPREEVEQLVDDLLGYGMVESAPSTALDAYLAGATQWRVGEGVDPDQRVLLLADEGVREPIRASLVDVLGEDRVTVVGRDEPALGILDASDTSWLTDALATEERMEAFADWRDAVVVGAFTSVNPVRSTVLNRVALHHGIPWVHSVLDGPFVFVGPSFLPGESSCYECLESRVMMNLRDAANYQRYKSAIVAAQVREGSLPVLRPFASLMAAHTVLEVLNLVLTGTTFTVGKMMAVHLPTMEVSMPEVLRLPGCGGCGAVPERDQQVLYFDPPVEPAVHA